MLTPLKKVFSKPSFFGRPVFRSFASEKEFATQDNNPNFFSIPKRLSEPVQVSEEIPSVPWFPTKQSDLDFMGRSHQNPDEEVGQDHPGFNDPLYVARRDEIAQTSLNYQMGQSLPYQKYTAQENKTWEQTYRILRPLQEKYMCESFNKNFERMVKAGVIKPTEIPQLQDLNEFLLKETNFRLKPVTGVLNQREFLNSLGLRTFCCTQYIRHHAYPEYSPEPDIIHEILGHVAMLVDNDFCNLSQEIGLISLGNNDENITKLGSLYWYTVEFGVCKEGNGVKGYGAGIASSTGEIMNFGEGRAELRPLNPFVELKMDYPTMCVQPMYYVAESFKSAGDMLIRYGEYLSKPFKASYDGRSGTIRVNQQIKLVETNEQAVKLECKRLVDVNGKRNC